MSNNENREILNATCIKLIGAAIVGTITVSASIKELFNIDLVSENTYITKVKLQNKYIPKKELTEIKNKYDFLKSSVSSSKSIENIVLEDYIKKTDISNNYILKSEYNKLKNKYLELTSIKTPITIKLGNEDFWYDEKLKLRIESKGFYQIGKKYITFDITLPNEETYKSFEISESNYNSFSKRFYYKNQPYKLTIKQAFPLIFEINNA